MRNQAERLAETDPVEALQAARRIRDPWYGCQAISWVGRYWADGDFIEILQEAAEVAARSSDPYQVVGARAWPVRALLERGARADAIAQQTVPLARNIENLGSRSEALRLLFEAVLPFESDLWRPVLVELVIASEPVLNWHQRRNFRHVARLLLERDAELARALTAMVSDLALKNDADKILEIGAPASPRPFFWRRGAKVSATGEVQPDGSD